MGFKSEIERLAVVEAAKNWKVGVSGTKWYWDQTTLDYIDRITDGDTKNC